MNVNEYFIVNAFTGKNARGNSCAVMAVDDLKADERLRLIAEDFNQPATAFIKQIQGNKYGVRWFAPEAEIDLCGHGAVASTWILTQYLKLATEVTFEYNQGELIGRSCDNGASISISGPEILSIESAIPKHITDGFNGKAIAYFTSPNKHIVLLERRKDVEEMSPNWQALRTSNTFSYAVTAHAQDEDFVSRVFLPYINKLEDQATGSAHMVLAPFWAERLNKNDLKAYQCSHRGGRVRCVVNKDEVELIARCEVIARGVLL